MNNKSETILNENSARQRILALRLLEKTKKNPELAKQLGIEVKMKKREEINNDDKKSQNESVTKLLSEAIELLNEAPNHGEKGNTLINLMKTGKDDLYNKMYKDISKDKSERTEFNKSIYAAKAALKNKDIEALELAGKATRESQRDAGEISLKDGSPIKAIDPIKDKEKMKRNNIKLGYTTMKKLSEIDRSQNESVTKLLSEAIELLND